MIATIAMMTACSGNDKSSSAASGSEASDAPESYSIEYNLGSNGGTNYACFDTFGSSDKIKPIWMLRLMATRSLSQCLSR